MPTDARSMSTPNSGSRGEGAARWNPRWLAYCRAEGVAPEDAGAIGFMSWNQRRLMEWRAETKHTGPLDHAAYDAWLNARWPEPTPTPTPPDQTMQLTPAEQSTR